MLFQEHMLKFSAWYEFASVYYLIALDYSIADLCVSIFHSFEAAIAND